MSRMNGVYVHELYGCGGTYRCRTRVANAPAFTWTDPDGLVWSVWSLTDGRTRISRWAGLQWIDRAAPVQVAEIHDRYNVDRAVSS